MRTAGDSRPYQCRITYGEDRPIAFHGTNAELAFKRKLGFDAVENEVKYGHWQLTTNN